MVALLVAMSIMAVALSVALPSWKTAAQREREEELIFRGTQYARAIALYQRKVANAFPPNIDLLVDQRFLRRKYKDPMTKDGEFQLLYVGQNAGQAGQTNQTAQAGVLGQQGRGGTAGMATIGGRGAAGGGPQGGILGVVSKSDQASLRLYNGRGKYNEWAFVATAASTTAGAPTGSQTPTGGIGGGPGQRGRGEGPGSRGGPGPGGRGGRGDGPGGRGQAPGPDGRFNGPGPGGQPGGGLGGFGGLGGRGRF